MPHMCETETETHIQRIEEASSRAVPSKSLRDNDLGQFQSAMRTNRLGGLLIGGWPE
jgi:hypothetical protein